MDNATIAKKMADGVKHIAEAHDLIAFCVVVLDETGKYAAHFKTSGTDEREQLSQAMVLVAKQFIGE